MTPTPATAPVALVPVRYGALRYPLGIEPAIDEVPGHFDRPAHCGSRPFSLHTEYSAGPRTWSSPLLQDLDEIKRSQRSGIAELWKSPSWSEQFAEFLARMCGGFAPTVIEVHPPFLRYCASNHQFLEVFGEFRCRVRELFPNAAVVIENRTGSRYPGKFLLRTSEDLVSLGMLVRTTGIDLGFAIDIPQLFMAEVGRAPPSIAEVNRVLDSVRAVADLVKTVHIWGRRGAAHVGTLDDLFGGNREAKSAMLSGLREILSVGPPRYFVPEVNSGHGDLESIVRDFLAEGFSFVAGPPSLEAA